MSSKQLSEKILEKNDNLMILKMRAEQNKVRGPKTVTDVLQSHRRPNVLLKSEISLIHPPPASYTRLEQVCVVCSVFV